MSLSRIISLVSEDLDEVNKKLVEYTKSDIDLINDVSAYIINSGGKRVRVILTLLFAGLLGVDRERAIKIAAITELIHTATILHDDVVDDSSMRRGLPTANKKYNNPAAVLVGDFVYTRAFQLIADFNDNSLMSLYTDAVNVIAEGEVRQLINLGDLTINEEKYFAVIYSKTARLFEVCCHAIAKLKYSEDLVLQGKLAKFGSFLGTGFQIIDDVIDYLSSKEESGKSKGDDLAEGKPTLPLIRLREVGSLEDKQLVEKIILQEKGLEVLDYVVERMEANDCFTYCFNRAYQEADKAKDIIKDFADSEYKQALLTLVELSVRRQA
ncbi:polyprenyl synthetase family protein [Psittacicella gerlachiana]|uniref:Octaprenyl-diphosphate synthase n=1 Tax=Psittacicella gerlachiana TaxID=2028574 RepID=A0A3A1XZD9_9GAMM|nr:polyprenyl synthetase family protein [Psittacicella gerlachiana]RIY31353.1 hypothetical protein CKF59_07700 [Psittacicella gerlachiana]